MFLGAFPSFSHTGAALFFRVLSAPNLGCGIFCGAQNPCPQFGGPNGPRGGGEKKIKKRRGLRFVGARGPTGLSTQGVFAQGTGGGGPFFLFLFFYFFFFLFFFSFPTGVGLVSQRRGGPPGGHLFVPQFSGFFDGRPAVSRETTGARLGRIFSFYPRGGGGGGGGAAGFAGLGLGKTCAPTNPPTLIRKKKKGSRGRHHPRGFG